MKYGEIPVDEAMGAVLAHSFKPPEGKPIRKGTVLGAAEIERIKAAGTETILAAILGKGDVGEDKAATRIGEVLAGGCLRAEAAATGRVNLHATANGLFLADRARVDMINSIDPGITLATLENLSEVNSGRLVATVKIIPYAVSSECLEQVLESARQSPIGVKPYHSSRVGVVSTMLPHIKPSVLDKTVKILERRLELSKSRISGEIRTDHATASIVAGIEQVIPESDIVLVFGASAICDIDDVIPSAIRQLGGKIEHFGMPVDPGNLLLVGSIGEKPVIGAPGCARSPAENGFDWVLRRYLAGLGVTAKEITRMGVGGLLMEIGTRPQPRERAARSGRVAAVVLAAGRSSRMGSVNKLTAPVNGEPMIARVIRCAAASNANPVIVVTGHEHKAVEREIKASGVRIVHNPRYADGLSTSLASGIKAVPKDCDAAIILLGDMPFVEAEMIDRMIEVHAAAVPGSIVLATSDGKRGNPVIWPRSFFDRLQSLAGDIGARQVIEENAQCVVSVDLGSAAARDIDTPEALAQVASEA